MGDESFQVSELAEREGADTLYHAGVVTALEQVLAHQTDTTA
jgi:hypothetical protein